MWTAGLIPWPLQTTLPSLSSLIGSRPVAPSATITTPSDPGTTIATTTARSAVMAVPPMTPILTAVKTGRSMVSRPWKYIKGDHC